MIIRIATEGQYEVPDDQHGPLNELDNRAVEAAQNGDESAFRDAWSALLAEVRERGEMLAPDDLRESEIIFPPPDLTLDEAQGDFHGDGLLPEELPGVDA